MKATAWLVSGSVVLVGAAVLYSSATVTAGPLQLVAVGVLFSGTVVAVLMSGPERWTVGSAVPVLVLAGVAALAVTDLPERAMLGFVRGDLQRIAENGKPGRAGPYRVEKPVRRGTAMLLPVSGSGWIFSHEGYAYAPGGASTIPPLGEGFESLDFWHLDGPWYRYHARES